MTEVKRPLKPGQWEVSARDEKTTRHWAELCNSYAGSCQKVFDRLSDQPDFDDGNRQHLLRGSDFVTTFEGVEYRLWQIDVTAGVRVWYFFKAEIFGAKQKRRSGRVYLHQIHFSHPKETE